MLGKLLKYEIKSYTRTFIPIYIAILLISFINGMFINTELFKVQEILSVILITLFVSVMVLSIVITIQRFRKNLLEDEGYLMFTLPVSTKNIIFSKYVVSLIFSILSMAVAGLSFFIITITAEQVSILDIFIQIKSNLKNLIYNAEARDSLLYLFVTVFAVYSNFILTLYLSLSMGQLPKLNKHRNLVAFVAFFIINMIISYSIIFISEWFSPNIYYQENITDVSSFYFTTSITMLIGSFIIMAILFGATSYILNKKLNLE